VRPSLRRELALEFCSVGWAESSICRTVLAVFLNKSVTSVTVFYLNI
jgi:hypothetical protein